MKRHIVALFLCTVVCCSSCSKRRHSIAEKAQAIIDDRIEAKLGGFKAKDLMEYDDIAGDVLDLIDDIVGGCSKSKDRND
jgi:hypothetical protein